EAMMSGLPVAGVLLLTVFFGRRALYPWSRPELVRHDPLLAARGGYLNTPFFFARMLLILTIWVLFALYVRRISLAQDRHGAGGHASHRLLGRLSAAFIGVFALSFSLASFDWLMSIDAHWYSTIFAVYCFAGMLLAGLAAITLTVTILHERGALRGIVNESHLHDLGKLLFAFSIFWAYIWLSQYLLIWYANIPDEASYYFLRTGGAWLPAFALVFVLNWIVPFTVLMTRAAKRNPAVLKWISVVLLAGHWLDLYVVVAPPVLARLRLGLPELLITAGYAGLFFYIAARSFVRAPVVAQNDPYLRESLHHHQ
ncbi:MAG: hypothetical protein M3O15_11410, partial [Acidobacteriota bacterium]|nr:hypothetical protein [Acidobacteriota bacterium]